MTRCCGDRAPGGTYAVSRLSPVGMPLEYFLHCPPRKVPEDIGLTPQGQVIQTVKYGDRVETHMFDWIGESNYLNVCDFLEEGRNLGFSWRIAPQNAARLGPRSFARPVHPHAFILNWREYGGRLVNSCPRAGLNRHSVPPESWDELQDWYRLLYPLDDEDYADSMCSGYWWQDVHGGMPVEQMADNVWAVKRQLPSVIYTAFETMGVKPQYAPGVLFKLLITGIEVIAGGETTDSSYAMLSKASPLPVSIVEE